MNTSPHFDDRLATRLSGVVNTQPVLLRLKQRRFAEDTAVVLHKSPKLVQRKDGSNGYYCVAIIRKGTGETVLWTRDLDVRRLNVQQVSYL